MHSAWNRDDYVEIMLENVKEGKEYNFNKYNTSNFNTTYDYDSIMHYTATAFSKNNKPTIVPCVSLRFFYYLILELLVE